jgi:pimeloyl-ACP methyl ester carboxylesterase
MMSMAAWEPVAALLRPSHQVIRCDLRGQLLSPGVPPSSMSGHAADVVRVLDELHVETVHVAGTSFGALAGLTLAALHPGRVRSVAAITATDHMTPEMWQGTVAVLTAVEAAIGGGSREAVFDLVAPSTFSAAFQKRQAEALRRRRAAVGALPVTWFTGLAGLLRSLERVDIRGVLSSITCPVLIVGAGDDKMFPPEYSRAIGENVQDARVIMLEGAPHGVVVEQPGEIASLIGDFIKRIERDCGLD